MKKTLLTFIVCSSLLSLHAQRPQGANAGQRPQGGGGGDTISAPRADKGASPFTRAMNPETSVVTTNTVTIKGQRVPYKATAGTLPVYDDDGKIIAGLFYTYYERTDISGDRSTRPLVISFNGGPGTASVWMHIGYTGPRMLKIDDEGNPIQPYGLKDNPNSLLDVADIVYVDPVNTGFSRAIGNVAKSKFFGVNADIKYLADWISTFVGRYKRWTSPKYLIGESYGTTRVSGLALELLSNHWIYVNGVILVSPTTLGLDRDVPTAAALRLPYFAATAWYHKKLPAELQKKTLQEYLPEVEAFTVDEFLPAIAHGGMLPDAKRKEIATRAARYAGLDVKVMLQNNFDVSTNLFWKELLRDQGFTVGRLDSRYRGLDRKDAGERPDYSPEQAAWSHEFAPPINMYLRDELGYKTDLEYYIFGSVRPWDNENNKTGDNLASAMQQNPFMHLLVQSGYFDGACDYFNAKYNMWQMDPAGKLKDRMFWEGYESGHMMYLRKPDLAAANDRLREFIRKSTPKEGQPAKY